MARAHAKLVMIALVSLGVLALGAGSASAQRRGGKKPPAAASSTPPPAPAAEPAGEAPTAVPAAGAASGSGSESESMVITPAEAGATAAPAAPAAGASEPGADKQDESAAAKGEKEAELQRELSQVMDSLVQARARAAVLGKALWKTTVAIQIDNRAGEDQVAVRVSLWLDGAPVWSGDGSALNDPERTLFSGFIAPGQHVLTYEVEQRARADEKYRYTQRASHRFSALKERRTELRLVLDDDSDIAEDFADDEEGEYDVRARLQVRAIAPGDE